MMPTQGRLRLMWDAKTLRIATDAAGIALWSWNVDSDEIELDDKAKLLWGLELEDVPLTFEILSARIHPQDLDRVRAAFNATREILGPYEIDFRILHSGKVAWVSARGRGEDQGIVGRIMFGVFLDVSQRKLAEEGRELLATEMSHRVKNLFAVATGLTDISLRSASTTEEMAADLKLRLLALGRAHELARPMLSEQKRATLLEELLPILLSAYDRHGSTGVRVRIEVPEILVGEASITTFALIIHELATNAVKYGALSTEEGSVEVTAQADASEVVVVWTELGGPPVRRLPGEPGFGSKLVNRSIASQFGGSIAFDWRTEGLVATLRMSKARLGV